MSDPHAELSPAAKYNARLGIFLFILYLLIYAGFVALSAFAPSVMAKPVIGGVNLAVVYGFALIGLAFVMAIMAIVQGRALAGALLIAFCPIVMFVSFAAMLGGVDARKQRTEEKAVR